MENYVASDQDLELLIQFLFTLPLPADRSVLQQVKDAKNLHKLVNYFVNREVGRAWEYFKKTAQEVFEDVTVEYRSKVRAQWAADLMKSAN